MSADGFGAEGLLLQLAQRPAPLYPCVAVDSRARRALDRLKLSLRGLAHAVFESAAELDLLVDVAGLPAWDFVTILVKFVDRRLPAARVRFRDYDEEPSVHLHLLRVSEGGRVFFGVRARGARGLSLAGTR